MKKLIFLLTMMLMLILLTAGMILTASAEVYNGTCGAEGNEENVT